MKHDAGGDQESFAGFGTGRVGAGGNVGVPGIVDRRLAGGVARVEEFGRESEHGFLDVANAAESPVGFGDVTGDLQFEVAGGRRSKTRASMKRSWFRARCKGAGGCARGCRVCWSWRWRWLCLRWSDGLWIFWRWRGWRRAGRRRVSWHDGLLRS
jgi:hypothetical protein